jgi:hypothetical protein
LFVFVFVLTFPHPGLYWIYGNKDDDDVGKSETKDSHLLIEQLQIKLRMKFPSTLCAQNQRTYEYKLIAIAEMKSVK